MKKIFISILLVSLSILAYADEPSFDCSKATAAIELKICNNDYLSDLDGLLAYNYKNAPWSEWDENSKKAFKSEQKAWMVKRNACSDENCLADAYKLRIDEICAIPTASGVNDCLAWERLGLDVDVASQAKVRDQQPIQQQSDEPPYKLDGYKEGFENNIELVSKVNGLHINKVVVNEGACPLTSTLRNIKRDLKMGEKTGFGVMISCNIIKITIETNQGSWTHTF